MEARIREAALSDVGAILELWSAGTSHPTVTDTPEEVGRLILEQPGAVLLAELDGELAGTLLAAWDGWRGSLYRLVVAPGRRRLGVGRALVEEAARRFRQRGVRRVSLFVVAADEEAVAFWDALAAQGLRRDPLPKLRYVWDL